MKPFILKQHDKDYAKVRELRADELERISGTKEKIPKLNTMTVTPDGDGGDDGTDEG
jgi:hypothetical protein